MTVRPSRERVIFSCASGALTMYWAFRVFVIPVPISKREGLLSHRMDYWKMDGKILKIGVASFRTSAQAQDAAVDLVGSMQRKPEQGGKKEFPAKYWWRGKSPEEILFVERNILVKVQCFARVEDN